MHVCETETLNTSSNQLEDICGLFQHTGLPYIIKCSA